MRKKITIFFIIGILVFSGFGLVASEDNTVIEQEFIGISIPVIKEEKQYFFSLYKHSFRDNK